MGAGCPNNLKLDMNARKKKNYLTCRIMRIFASTLTLPHGRGSVIVFNTSAKFAT